MKLYYVPGACSRSPHIVLNELGVKFEAVRLDPKTKTVPEGDYWKINPKGQVPALKLHKGLSPLFNPKITDEAREQTKNNLSKKLDYLSEQLGNNQFIMGSQFTIADAYCYTVLGWTKRVGVDLSKWPKLMSLLERVEQRPSVRATLATET